jgi:glycosyltransferase involved in cell wall biosynthesis
VAIEACRRVGAPLRIVGRGPEQARLEGLARPSGNQVRFLGWRSDAEVRELYQSAAAVLLPGIEDFGMVPVEAQACGVPVVALGAGGACETVRHGTTGILAADDSVEAFATALEECLRTPFDRAVIRASAERFSRERFLRDFPAVVSDALRAQVSARPEDRAYDQPGDRRTSGGADDDPGAQNTSTPAVRSS